VIEGKIGRRRGRGKAYSDTTIEGMRRSWIYLVRPEFGPRIASEISEIDWQHWIDGLARNGCTEIDLLVGPEDASVPVFDTTRIHVDTATDWALG